MAKGRSKLQTKDKISSSSIKLERCLNPWNDKCENTDIAVYIMHKGKTIPLCWKCWRKISKSNVMWEAY